jgi:transposase
MNSGPRRNRCWQSVMRVRGDRDVAINGAPVEVGRRWRRGKSSRPSFMCCAPDASGRRCLRILVVRVQSMRTSNDGATTDFSCGSGRQVWPNTTKWRESLGRGRVSMAPWARPPSPKKLSDPIRRIGEKKGTKRSLLVDGLGAPLSLIVSGANRHDVKLLDSTLDGIVVRRPRPTRRQPQHLCADKAHRGKPAAAAMRKRGYTPHVRQIAEETRVKRRGQPARRWVVERSHSWFNRFRKLLVRYEKKENNYLALTHCAAAIICFRMA